jgi:hypothetical protein
MVQILVALKDQVKILLKHLWLQFLNLLEMGSKSGHVFQSPGVLGH